MNTKFAAEPRTFTKEQKRVEVQKIQLAMAMDKKACEKSLYYFYREAFAVLEPSTPYKEGWHIEYLCFILQREFERIIQSKPSKYGEIIINVPPRTSKSLIFSVVFPVWCWLRNPSFPLITTSYSMDLATKFSFQSQQLMRSKWFQDRWPEEYFSFDRRHGGKESTEYTVTNKQGTRKVASTGSNLTGFGGLIILSDDPQSPMQANSEAETRGAIEFYTGTLSSRLNDQNVGVIVTIMQRLSESDLSAFILERDEEGGNVLHVNLPSIKDGSEKMPAINKIPHLKPYPGGILFPALLGERALENIRRRLGDLTYSTQYLQHPFPADGIIAKREHFLRMTPEEFDLKFRGLAKVWDTVVDTSYGDSKRADADPSGALTFWAYQGKVYIRNFSTKRVPSENLPEYLLKLTQSHGLGPRSKMLVEPKASGKTVVGLLRKLYKHLSVQEFKYRAGGVNLNSSKIERLRAILPYLAGGNVVLIDGLWCESFINEVIGFPNTKHDEAVDCLVMACINETLGRGSSSGRHMKLLN